MHMTSEEFKEMVLRLELICTIVTISNSVMGYVRQLQKLFSNMGIEHNYHVGEVFTLLSYTFCALASQSSHIPLKLAYNFIDKETDPVKHH